MNGIIKGSLFTIILMFIVICILSAVSMIVKAPVLLLRSIMWGMFGLCNFLGALPVSRSAESGKILRGISVTLISLFVLFIASCIVGKCIPANGNFYILCIICLLGGILGAFTGTK